MWVDTVSLGKVARSTTRTRYPLRASSIAVGEPAQRAPTTIASNALVIAASRSRQASTAPSCCIRPSSSTCAQHSTTLPSVMRSMSVPVRRISLPVAGTPWKLALVRAAGGPAGHHHVAFGDLVLDGEMEVRERRAQHRDVLLGPLAPADVLGRGVDDQVAGRHFVDDTEITPAVGLLDDAPDLRLVLL